MPKVKYLGPADRLGTDEQNPKSFVSPGESITLSNEQLAALVAAGHQFEGYERHFSGGAVTMPATTESKGNQ